MLRRHPQIFMPENKEPWFFAAELHERTPPRPAGTPTTMEEYLALFAAAGPGQRVGEATILYLWSHTAADAIAEVIPDARIVAILREPASLLRSLHLQFLESLHRDRDGPAHGARARARPPRGPARTAPHLLARGARLLRARALRRAAAPLRAALRRRAHAGADLRRLPPRQRRRGPLGAALPGGRRERPAAAGRGQPDGRGALAGAARARACAHRGARPGLAGRQGCAQAGGPTTAAPRRRAGRQAPLPVRRAAAPRRAA